MAPVKTYTFRYLQIQFVYGMLISLLIISVIIPITLIYMTNALGSYLSIILGGIFFAGFIYCAVKITKKNKETVRISNTVIESNHFGTIYFSDIVSYSIKSGISKINVAKPAPSLIVYNKAGKKMRFDMDGVNYYDEIQDYIDFIKDFIVRIKTYDIQHAQTSASGLKTSTKIDHVAGMKALQKAEMNQQNIVKNIMLVSVIAVIYFIIRLFYYI
ncbi:hypothetical protein [Xanthomarina sp.]|uniref:hypothetical protein n=1 Tax=Xanthomarina sp. TaxID=1931211 RepID=UPI002CDEEB6D|nr:hypothetical protein [Xanthomarina sp.]HLV40512.1 hypothetical protein [Xanthomarina sp.]